MAVAGNDLVRLENSIIMQMLWKYELRIYEVPKRKSRAKPTFYVISRFDDIILPNLDNDDII